MTDQLQPEWRKGFSPTPLDGSGNPGWKKGMRSPNPKGRPLGSAMSKRERIGKALNDDGPEVVRKVIDAALAGDMQAAGLVMSRLTPPLKAQSEPVQFSFDPCLPIAKQVEAVLAAVAAGEVAPDVGQTIVAMISNLANVRATEEMELRLTLLEAKAVQQ